MAGGVAANTYLREEIKKLGEEEKIEVCFPPMSYCTDNAAMIAAAGYFAYQDNRISDLNLKAKSNDLLS